MKEEKRRFWGLVGEGEAVVVADGGDTKVKLVG